MEGRLGVGFETVDTFCYAAGFKRYYGRIDSEDD